jgi:hypothetical protein
MINDFREDVLKDTLRSLPNLRGLHVIGCSKLDHLVVLGHLIHTPLLESLSMTTAVSGPVSGLSRYALYRLLTPFNYQSQMIHPCQTSFPCPYFLI